MVKKEEKSTKKMKNVTVRGGRLRTRQTTPPGFIGNDLHIFSDMWGRFYLQLLLTTTECSV